MLRRTEVENIKDLPPEVKAFRDILDDTFGNNTQFAGGGGFTVTPDGKIGLREWILSKPAVGFNYDLMHKAGFHLEKNIELSW